jgi:hypothetical protein
MTESEWLGCIDLKPMLAFLRRKTSDRKLRLFAVACCRSLRYWLSEDSSRRAIVVMEQYADGKVKRGALTQARKEAGWFTEDGFPGDPDAPISDPRHMAALTVWWAAYEWLQPNGLIGLEGGYAEVRRLLPPKERRKLAEASDLLREIVGNPFGAISVDPVWLAWNGGTVGKLAGTIYDDRSPTTGYLDPERLAILADALEDASCTDATILDHLRGPGPHCRGCWAVDLLLGRS